LPADKPGGRACTEAQFDQERITQFIEAGILPLTALKNKDFVFTLGDTTISGDSLSYQILVSRISHFVVWLKDRMEGDLSPQALKDHLIQAFSLFWESTGHPKPDDLDISVGPLNDRNRMPIRITLSPSRRILASSQSVELEFNWQRVS
jgi:type VI secretion system protein ImpC